MLGNPGQATASGRPLPLDELEQDGPPAPRALPPLCLRALQAPRATCEPNCPGTQPDGSCLADKVRVANLNGFDWRFEIDRDGYWCYQGPEL